jgi:hypothetical protein
MDIGRFTESNDILDDPPALRSRLMKYGYLFVRELLPKDKVLELRRQILEVCVQAGWLRPGSDIMEGLTDHEPILESEPPWIPVYEKVNKLETFHRLKLHPNVRQMMEAIFEEPVFCLPTTIARIAFPRDNERATQPHQDWIFIQGSTETLSCWAPLGDIPEAVGGLMILEGSHKSGLLVPRLAPGPGGNTVDVDPTLRWLATDYRAGDVLFFKQLAIHGARPNQTLDRLRLSVDFRYTGISHTITELWLEPHFSHLNDVFSWDNLDKDWTDGELRRYWERGPKMKTIPHRPSSFFRAK